MKSIVVRGLFGLACFNALIAVVGHSMFAASVSVTVVVMAILLDDVSPSGGST